MYNYQEFILNENYKRFLNNKDFILSSRIDEGGAYGHLSHPFEDMYLTMQDIKDMISAAVKGLFTPENFVQEKCLHESTEVILKNKGKVTISELVENRYEDDILSINDLGEVIYQPILDWVNNGISEEWLLIKTDNGEELILTPNHRVVLDGFDVKAEELKIGDKLTIT